MYMRASYKLNSIIGLITDGSDELSLTGGLKQRLDNHMLGVFQV